LELWGKLPIKLKIEHSNILQIIKIEATEICKEKACQLEKDLEA
jgi:hypothetical protein